jgi:very-short-patch-repair endonuclease
MGLPQVVLPGRQHPAGPFIVDFVSLSARLAIEIDGSGHDSRIHRGEARDEWLANQGFLTMRIAAANVLRDLDAVMRGIVASCDTAAQPVHQPGAGPPPRTGEDL